VTSVPDCGTRHQPGAALGYLAGRLLEAVSIVGGLISRIPARVLPDLLVHTLVPIALGYVTAHDLTLLILEGQRVLLNASDPLDRGLDLFGTRGRRIDSTIVGYRGLIGLIQAGAAPSRDHRPDPDAGRHGRPHRRRPPAAVHRVAAPGHPRPDEVMALQYR
jgi:hypothetical protein